MIFHILTIFPEMFNGFLNESILKKAQGNGHITIHIHNIRDYSKDKHKKVDDNPYGGGAGMLFTPQPLFDCIESVRKLTDNDQFPTLPTGRQVSNSQFKKHTPVIYLSPRGKRLTQPYAEQLNKKFDQYILICGHYEGIDQRVIDECVDFELSIGDFVMSGGELGAMVFIDVVSRLNTGVLGNDESHQEETFSKRLNRKKEYPHYTRPADFRGLKVPDVLLNGNHAEIEKWRRGQLK